MAEEEKDVSANGKVTHEEQDDGSESEASEMEKKVIRQMEYYFGDHNLPRDKYLQQKVKENDEGWVTLECMITFNRLRALTEDSATIVAALRKSKRNIVEISADETQVKRAKDNPVPEDTLDYRNQLKSRTLYCKGFSQDMSLAKVDEFLSQFGDIDFVMMRRNKDRSFKGSVFCTFRTVAECENLLSEEGLECKGTPLIRHFKDDYFRLKTEERKKNKDDRKKEKEDEKIKKLEEEVKKEVEGDNFDKGCVLHLSDVPVDGTLARDTVKGHMSEQGSVRWIDLDKGDTDCYVRFNTANGAKEVFDKIAVEGVVTISDIKLKARVLEGEEEKSHWEKVFTERAHAFANKKNKGRMSRDKGKRTPKMQGYRGSNRGGRGDGGSEKKAAKVVFDSSEDDSNDESTVSTIKETAAKRPLDKETQDQPETKVAKTESKIKVEVEG